MQLVQTRRYSKAIKKILTEPERLAVEESIAHDPEKGVVIRGTGGLRKLRIAAKGHGKRGGARVIYYFWREQELILLLAVYAKNQQEDLSPAEQKMLAKEIEDIKDGNYDA